MCELTHGMLCVNGPYEFEARAGCVYVLTVRMYGTGGSKTLVPPVTGVNISSASARRV